MMWKGNKNICFAENYKKNVSSLTVNDAFDPLSFS